MIHVAFYNSYHTRKSGFRNLINFCLWNPEPEKILLVESRIWENFTCGIRKPRKFCLWNPEPEKILLVESGNQESFACGIQNLRKFCLWNPEPEKILLVESRIWENFTCGIRNPRKFCLWNPEPEKIFLLESGTQEIFCLWNPESGKIFLWNPESGALESGIQLKESANPLKIGQVPLTKTGIQYLGIRNPLRGIQNPRLSFLDSLTWGDIIGRRI